VSEISTYPDEHPILDSALIFQIQGIRINALNGAIRLDGNTPPCQRLIGILVQLAVIGREDVRRNIIYTNMDVMGDIRIEIAKFPLGQIVQLGGQLDAGGTSADNGDMQESADLLGCRGGQRRLFKKIKQQFPHRHGVGHILYEQGVFGDAGRVEGVGHAPRSQDEQVILNIELLLGEFGVIIKCWGAMHRLCVKVHIENVGLDEFLGGARFGADGFFSQVEIELTACCGG
jgi:hypothetical protein